MCKVLKRHGWVEDRVESSHHTFKKPGVMQIVTVTVHGHKTMKLGHQCAVMKQAGLTEVDL